MECPERLVAFLMAAQNSHVSYGRPACHWASGGVLVKLAYGFQGFSYPLENKNCSAWENGYEAMYRDFKQMKRDFGASIIRMYYPECTKPTVFENALKAAATNNVAIIFQVWTNLDKV